MQHDRCNRVLAVIQASQLGRVVEKPPSVPKMIAFSDPESILEIRTIPPFRDLLIARA